jgi:hypothetical protein
MDRVIVRKGTTGEPTNNKAHFGSKKLNDGEDGMLGAAAAAADTLDNAALVAAAAEALALNDDSSEDQSSDEEALAYVQQFQEDARRRRERIKWGQSDVHEGGRAPNGEKFDSLERIAPGIDFLGTPGHGYYCVSPERNKAIAPALRNRSGKYEEDDELRILTWTFPEAFPKHDYSVEAQAVRDGFPDQYEKATGQKLGPGESRSRDRETWTARHANDYIVTSAMTDDEDPAVVNVSARLGGAGEERLFIVPTSEYKNREDVDGELGKSGRFVIDLDSHREVQRPAPVALTLVTGLSTKGVTASAEQRIEKDLSKWAMSVSGHRRTLRTIINDEGVSGKSSSVNNFGQREYTVNTATTAGESGGGYIVSKATYDAVNAPDSRTPSRIISDDIQVLNHKIEKLTASTKNAFFSVHNTTDIIGNRKKIAADTAKRDALRIQRDQLDGA